MTISDHDRTVIEGHLQLFTKEATDQVPASLNLAREAVRNAVIEYAVRTGLEDDKASGMVRELIENLEWGVCRHFVEYEPDCG